MQSVALSDTCMTMQMGGIPIRTLPISAVSALARTQKNVESTDIMPVDSAERDRRSDSAGRRWSDQDHDELIRHSEILRSIDSSLRTLFGSISEQNARYETLEKDLRTLGTTLESRIRSLENAERGREGYERGLMEAARSTASTRAVIISLAIGLIGLIGSTISPLITKALGH